MVSIEALLEENFKQKELREKRKREKEEKEKHRREALSVKKEQLMKTKGCVPRAGCSSSRRHVFGDLAAVLRVLDGRCRRLRLAPHAALCQRRSSVRPPTLRAKLCRYQRLLAQEYDRKLKEARKLGKRRFNVNETVDGERIAMPDYYGTPANGLAPASGKDGSGSASSAFNLQEFIRMNGAEASGACAAVSLRLRR